MLNRQKRYFCPVCNSDLGVYPTRVVFLVTCPDEDCRVKWCYKPDLEKPIPLDWPGMKKPKICGCESCRARK